MDTEKQSNLLYDALKEEYKGFIDDALKTVGFLLLALGWLLTSDNAENVLATRSTSTVSVIIILSLTINIMGVFGAHFARSRKIRNTMLALEIHPPVLIANYAISLPHLLLIGFAILPLLGLLGKLILGASPTD